MIFFSPRMNERRICWEAQNIISFLFEICHFHHKTFQFYPSSSICFFSHEKNKSIRMHLSICKKHIYVYLMVELIRFILMNCCEGHRLFWIKGILQKKMNETNFLLESMENPRWPIRMKCCLHLKLCSGCSSKIFVQLISDRSTNEWNGRYESAFLCHKQVLLKEEKKKITYYSNNLHCEWQTVYH